MTTLEQLLTSRAGFDLDASPLQRAITRAADGLQLGEGLSDSEVRAHFGCERSQIGLCMPVLVAVIAGVRSGKSFLAACAAVKAYLTADLSALKPHEIARFAIVAPTVDNASATFRLLVGSVMASPVLSRMVVGEPSADTLTMRRPDGRVVEIVVVAASRGAITLRSRWLVGFCLDEVSLFGTESTGAVVNAEELLHGGETRLVRGGQGWLTASPYGPSGLLHALWLAHFGKPGRVLVVHAPTSAMNPAFPLAQIEAIRARAPDVASREYDAAWVDADSAFLDGVLVDQAVRREPLEEPRIPGAVYCASMDPATRGNGWALIIARAEQLSENLVRVVVAVAREWKGNRLAPLDPDATLAEIANVLREYGLSDVACDGWAVDALASIGRVHGIELLPRTTTAPQAYEAWDGVRTLLSQKRLILAPHPLLVQDLKGLRKRATASALRVELPHTADGRHADLGAALQLAVHDASRDLATPGWTSPGFAEHAATFFGGQFEAAVFGAAREKKAPPLKSWTLSDGTQEVAGNPPAWPSSFSARWTRGAAPRFSPQATQPFRDAVARYRSEHPEVR